MIVFHGDHVEMPCIKVIQFIFLAVIVLIIGDNFIHHPLSTSGVMPPTWVDRVVKHESSLELLLKRFID